TPGYLAPEVLDRKGHGVPSDVWALGCATYVGTRREGRGARGAAGPTEHPDPPRYMLLTGSPPFEAAQRQELYRCIQAAQYPLPPHLSPRARTLIARLLAPEPVARPSLRDVLDHGFFTQVWGAAG
ncbi:PLK2 kinase, partial [Chionis minor]|nr:PLK2 kinase [Chionis minor]